jgi:hypothetical protein
LKDLEVNEVWKDPIVEEIHAVREEIARRFNYDLGEIMAYYRKLQEAHPERIVTKEELERRRAGQYDQESDGDASAKTVANEPSARHG